MTCRGRSSIGSAAARWTATYGVAARGPRPASSAPAPRPDAARAPSSAATAGTVGQWRRAREQLTGLGRRRGGVTSVGDLGTGDQDCDGSDGLVVASCLLERQAQDGVPVLVPAGGQRPLRRSADLRAQGVERPDVDRGQSKRPADHSGDFTERRRRRPDGASCRPVAQPRPTSRDAAEARAPAGDSAPKRSRTTPVSTVVNGLVRQADPAGRRWHAGRPAAAPRHRRAVPRRRASQAHRLAPVEKDPEARW